MDQKSARRAPKIVATMCLDLSSEAKTELKPLVFFHAMIKCMVLRDGLAKLVCLHRHTTRQRVAMELCFSTKPTREDVKESEVSW
mmetsp:Transcript_23657/g.65671  ORF Transcript_23657/g.65671 Transcript_23657/m.65671 type:complete len:85 (+) Transcript_23657:105-359(+)